MGVFSRLMWRSVLSHFQKTHRPAVHSRRRPQVEELEGRLLLHASPVLDAEHLAVFRSKDTTGAVVGGLVPDAAVEYRSFASGKWSDNIWEHHVGNVYVQDGTHPGNGDDVVISVNTTVTMVGTSPALRTIRDDGTFTFDPLSTDRQGGYLLVAPTGTFKMGTANQRIDSAHSAKVIFVSQMSNATVSSGTLCNLVWAWSHMAMSAYTVPGHELCGRASALAAKTTTFDLGSVPTGWAAGDRLIITGNTAANASGQNQDEEAALTSINGSVVTLAVPSNIATAPAPYTLPMSVEMPSSSPIPPSSPWTGRNMSATYRSVATSCSCTTTMCMWTAPAFTAWAAPTNAR